MYDEPIRTIYCNKTIVTKNHLNRWFFIFNIIMDNYKDIKENIEKIKSLESVLGRKLSLEDYCNLIESNGFTNIKYIKCCGNMQELLLGILSNNLNTYKYPFNTYHSYNSIYYKLPHRYGKTIISGTRTFQTPIDYMTLHRFVLLTLQYIGRLVKKEEIPVLNTSIYDIVFPSKQKINFYG